ncbi:LysR family transcriptional regulator [Legionella sainthelensi]|uniref:LysR family transcriptional regulator n=1 Tax=Legionella sainthelensi TaxID=28087 RepID=A0A0W0YSH3_9GAMM|nr:LysR family transcriptional regulator [Legionella sainthelensi]KTD59802.1 LysR family transcriptional regulator [Legionella sainthelensi]VEH31426.1 LysR family transcriptional regulator [Legionella sainthelensi]
MNIVELKSFLAVVEYHSISLASKKMNVTQPAITKRIQKLEAELGVQLFKKSGMRTELTDKGKLSIPYIRQLLHTYEGLMFQLAGKDDHSRLLSNIGASVYIAQSVLPEIQKYISSLNTNLLMNVKLIHERDVADGLFSGNFDVIISPLCFSFPKTVASTPLWREKLIIVAADDHPLHHKENVTLEELALYDAVVMEKEIAIRQKIDELLWSNNLNLRVISEANTIYNNIAMTQQGLGWSVIYERLLTPGLSPIKVEGSDLYIDFHVYFLMKRKEERMLRLLIGYLQQFINASSGWKQFAIKSS